MHSDADELADKLQYAASLGPKPLVRSTQYTCPATDSDREHELFSWKALESAYRDFGSTTLPTLARGLFLEQCPDSHWRVAVRGYDKFFNVGELPWTRPQAIAAYSQGPYILTHKENGCIIFVAALSPRRIVVTSKHSLYLNEPDRVSHADMGRRWLERHLGKANKTEEQLAAELWERNQTAVFELCDDQFEEHVLAYPPERSGLHLHGLNDNTEAFSTASMDEVTEFAGRYGFIPVRYKIIETLEEVESFATEVAKTGSIAGEAIEGFVVRTTMPANVEPVPGVVPPPYAPGQAWFYKIKFDEPYLMYRQWRELTKTMISTKAQWDDAVKIYDDLQRKHESDAQESEASGASKGQIRKERKNMYSSIVSKGFSVDSDGVCPPALPKVKDQRVETLVYVKWCHDHMYGNRARGIEASPELFEGFADGHGIIALRDRFLAYLDTPDGAAALAAAKRDAGKGDLRDDTRPFEKTLIVPIAVPGTGKTALAVALHRLFPAWAHVQSDDVQTKRTGPTFLRNVESALRDKTVVIADRNNHLEQHREEFVDIVRRVSGPQRGGGLGPRVRLVALFWRVDELPTADIHELLAQRIVDRGERHQCLRVGEKETFAYDAILRRFITELVPFDEKSTPADAQFSECISFSLLNSLEDNLHAALDALVPMLGLERPAEEAVRGALESARQYAPTVRKATPQTSVRDPNAIYKTSYIGVSVAECIDELAGKLVSSKHAKQVLEKIVAVHRVVPNPHVTLVHQFEMENEDAQRRWDIYFEAAKERPRCTMQITGVAWSDRVMSLEVKSLRCETLDIGALQGDGFLPHITVGVTSASTKHIEGREVFALLAQGGAEGVYYESVTPHELGGTIEFFSNPP
ncbi:RNA ligase (ATP) [Malassezia cuniculi]|uniref:tRNA ligase n=1 Tax=Malassezia cuniculi TaxID=948313 RepID=A0AAF0ENZ0_9BASI|nr:RNA ligase (ATP) [Malassezia cuniculi]